MENISKIKNIIWQIANTRLAFAFLLLMALLNLMGTNKLSAQTTLGPITVAASSDDAEEAGSGAQSPYYIGAMYLVSTDLEMVTDLQSPANGVQKVGMRFTGITIPKGSTITNAYLTFKSRTPDAGNNNTGTTNLTIKGHLSANSPTFSSTDFDITNRSLTTASSSWPNVETWSGDNNAYNSPAITSVIQEIVNQSTWVSGNALSIIITGTGSRTAYSYDLNTGRAPQLTITYTACELNATVTKTNLSCDVNNDGTITVSNATGGSGTFQYRLNTGAWQSSSSFTGLTAGTYSVQIRDAVNTACEKTLGSYIISTYSALPFVRSVSSGFGVSGTTVTIPHTTGTRNNRLMLVGISTRQRTVQSVFYGTNELDLVESQAVNTDAMTSIYALQDPPSGTNNVVVTFAGGDLATDKAGVVGVMTFSNVDPLNPVSNVTNLNGNKVNTASSVSISSTSTNQLVFGVFAVKDKEITNPTDRLLYWNLGTSSYTQQPRGAGGTKIASSTSTALSYTISGDANWGFTGLAINPIFTADLGIAKTVDEPAPYAGQTVTFTLTATNNGCDNATGTSVIDALPTGYIYSSSSTANGTYDAGSGQWAIGTLNSGATATLTIQATVLASGNYQNTATISSDASDLVAGNNSASVGIIICQAGGNAPLFNNN